MKIFYTNIFFILNFLLFINIYAVEEEVEDLSVEKKHYSADEISVNEDESAGNYISEELKEEVCEDEDAIKVLTIKAISELLENLKKEKPELYKKIQKEDIEKGITGFFRGISSEFRFRSTDDSEKNSCDYDSEDEKKAKGDGKAYSGITIADNKIFYYRLDKFNSKNFEKFLADYRAVARSANPPLGLALDLRNCSGYDYLNMLKTLKLFASQENIPYHHFDPEIKKTVNMPTAVLIGKKTCGASEVFAEILKETEIITMGEKTGGKAYLYTPLKVGNEFILQIPEKPNYLSDFEMTFSEPEIEISTYPQLSYEKISSEENSEYRDSSISAAIDVLIGIEALNKKSEYFQK